MCFDSSGPTLAGSSPTPVGAYVSLRSSVDVGMRSHESQRPNLLVIYLRTTKLQWHRYRREETHRIVRGVGEYTENLGNIAHVPAWCPSIEPGALSEDAYLTVVSRGIAREHGQKTPPPWSLVLGPPQKSARHILEAFFRGDSRGDLHAIEFLERAHKLRSMDSCWK